MRTWRPQFPLCLVILIALLGSSSALAFDGPHPAWRTQGKAQAAGPELVSEAVLQASLPLLDDGSAALQRQRGAGFRAPSEVRALALMVAFSDSGFYDLRDTDGLLPESTQSEFLYAAHDSSFFAHLMQNVADYYDQNSGGRFSLETTVHGEVVYLDQPMAYYGDHPEEGEQPILLAQDAIAAADPQVDFSLYDTLILIHAGAGEETDGNGDSPEQIYSNYLGIEDFQEAVDDTVLAQPYLPTDDHPEGEGLLHVLVLPECEYQDPGAGSSGYYGSLGVYCFEMGLRLGMLSLFDFTDNDSQGIGQMGLMGFGLWSAGGLVPPAPCAFNKQLMGWLDPYVVDAAADDTWTLNPAADPADPQACARVDMTGSEYFLVEYRLQDADGNNRFSFEVGDLNHNGVPDFYDADSAAGDGTPTTYFDPATDTPERFLEAEWDFFLTDNAARTGDFKAQGSGLCIWHVDEGVIRSVWDAERNLFNGDPDHKSVDLEEADGIQDLDTRQGSAYWLGADVDTWKGEVNHTFDPFTMPDTRTNGGAVSGLVINQISNVVADSTHVYNAGTEDEYTGILFAANMSFRCAYSTGTDQPEMTALDLPGVDLVGSHLRTAEITTGDLVAFAASEGRLFALTTGLVEVEDHDGDPASIEPLATGSDADGEPVTWVGSVTLGDFEPGGDPELVVAAERGLYAFRADGTPVVAEAVPGRDTGLVAGTDHVTQPVALLPLADGATDVVACLSTVDDGLDGAPTVLRFLDHEGADFHDPVTLPGLAAGEVLLAGNVLLVPVAGFDGTGHLVILNWRPGDQPAVQWTVNLDLVPGSLPLTVVDDVVLVSDGEGRVQTVDLDGATAGELWPDRIRITSSIGGGGGVLAGDRYGRIAETGAWQQGWPETPRLAMAGVGAEPLALGHPDRPEVFIFAARDGRVFAHDRFGGAVDGYPVAGPADLVSTPALIRTNATAAMLVAAGSTPAITGVDPDTDSLATEPVLRLRAWSVDMSWLSVPGVAWGQYGGSALGRIPQAAYHANEDSWRTPKLADRHVCYPQPLRQGTLKVRGLIDDDGMARAVILNLQGEVVRDTGAQAVPGRAPFELEIDLDGVASGLYLCKLQAGGETSLKTIAVTR